MKKILFLWICLLSFWNATAYAAFVSGSTGALGAFDPPGDTEVILPPDGVLNYTTINVRAGVTVTFKKNAANTPVYMLATGDVSIAGTIDVSGGSSTSSPAGIGGPGAYDGGYGGPTNSSGGKGLGPGGGQMGPTSSCGHAGGGGYGTNGGTYPGCGAGGSSYGNARIAPLMGGSGGGGMFGGSVPQWGGGGGGGAILIATSEPSSIAITGSIKADGGNAYACNGSAGGSGGAIKLIAATINGNGTVSAKGGNSNCWEKGGQGRIRIEAVTNNMTSSSNPSYSFGSPSSIFIPSPPSLTITSIAGAAVPSTRTGSYTQPDIMLPSTTVNPVDVNISAANIPTDTTVNVWVIPQFGAATSVTATLSGTQQASSTAASVNLSTTYANVITAEVTFTVVAMYYDGEEINKVRVATKLGGGSETTYITKSGKEIKGELVAALR